MITTRTEKVIDVSDWDQLIIDTYGKPYSFQQQDGCQRVHLTVPTDGYDFEAETVPEIVNHEEMGVSFKAWLARDPKQQIPNETSWSLELWWERNFYPTIESVANDLYEKGLIESGDYTIDIDW